MAESFTRYYWTLFKHFGIRVWDSKGAELVSALVVAIATFVVSWLFGEEKVGRAFEIAIVSLVCGLMVFAFWHLMRSPWLIHYDGDALTKTQSRHWGCGIGGIVVFVAMATVGLSGPVWIYATLYANSRPMIQLAIKSADPGVKDAQIYQLQAEIKRLEGALGQRGHWTREGIQNSYLTPQPTDTTNPTEYTAQIRYTGTTTFNPIRVRITFNQALEGKLAKILPQAAGSNGVFVKAMARGDSLSAVHFCGDDLRTTVTGSVLIIECGRGQMNAPDELLVGINLSKKIAGELSIIDVQRWDKD